MDQIDAVVQPTLEDTIFDNNKNQSAVVVIVLVMIVVVISLTSVVC